MGIRHSNDSIINRTTNTEKERDLLEHIKLLEQKEINLLNHTNFLEQRKGNLLKHIKLLEQDEHILKNYNIKSLTGTKLKIPDYEYMVLSGGAVKGISFCGALIECDKRGILYDENCMLKLKGICGVSAGSIVASLLAIGYTPTELVDIMKTLDFNEIVDDKLGYIRDMFNFVEDWGVCPGDYIQNFIGNLIGNKTGNPDYTLEDLYNDKKIKLVIVVTNLSYQKSVYLYPGNPEKKYSNIPIRKAIRMSMGIPFLFEPYLYESDYFVDGGILDNFPLHVFDGEFPGDQEARLNLVQPNDKTLGLNITPVNEEDGYNIVSKQNYTSLLEYSSAFINTFLTENERRMMIPSFWKRTMTVITPVYQITKFDITDEQKMDLIKCGEDSAISYFDKMH